MPHPFKVHNLIPSCWILQLKHRCVCLSGTGEVEESVTVKTLFIMPEAEPTQDSTKDFTPKVETSTYLDVPKDKNKRLRIEVGTSCKVLLSSVSGDLITSGSNRGIEGPMYLTTRNRNQV